MNIIEWKSGKNYRGHAVQDLLDKRFWRLYESHIENSIERDGQIKWNGIGLVSETGKISSFPTCVIDDYGYLMPVPDIREYAS